MGADLLAWAFRSPRRLISTVVAVVAVLIVGALLWGPGGGGSTPSTVTATPSATAAVPDSGPAVSAAVAFVQAWGKLQPGETAPQWRARVARLSTTDLTEALALTDPSSLPNAAPQGEPVVRFVSRASALIAVPLSTGDRVVVTMSATGTEWLATDVQPDVGDGPT